MTQNNARSVRTEVIIDKALDIIRNSPKFDNGFSVRDVVSIIRFQTDSKLIPHPSSVRHYLMRKRGEVDIVARHTGTRHVCVWKLVDNGDGDGARPKEDRA